MKRTISALTIVTALSAFAAPAVHAMGEELTMLELAVNNALTRVGVQDVDVNSLTVSELALIKGILESDDSEGRKRERIENVVAR